MSNSRYKMAQTENQIGQEVKKSTVREVNQLIAYSEGDPLYDTEVKEEQQFWKRIMIVDDDADVTVTFKAGIEDSNNSGDVNKRIEVYTSNNSVIALSEFKSNFYDLLLVDIKMPQMNGFELSERILAIDISVRICFMSSGEIHRKALREIYPSLSVGCLLES